MRFLSTTPNRSTNIADSTTRENSDTLYFKNTANNMVMMIVYCTDRSIETAAVYFTHALLTSAKGLTASPNQSFDSLNRLFREYASPT